jgi:transcription elongation factor Elf1
MEYGEIYKFEVTATCPHCAEQTDVTQSEMRSKEVQCQHCDESFQVVLDSY